VLLLAFTCERVRHLDEHLVNLVHAGDVAGALRIGQERFERAGHARDAERHAALGQMLGRILLAADRAGDAEELFQRMPRTYESISRAAVRWHSSLDQGALAMHLGRWGRAAEAWHLVADDDTAPPALRIEGMCCLAAALYRLGEHRRAISTVREAERLAAEHQLAGMAALTHGLEVELGTCHQLDTVEGLTDCSLTCTDARLAEEAHNLDEELAAQAEALAHVAPVARRLRMLRLMLGGHATTSAGRAQILAELKWLKACGLVEREASLRVTAALTMLAKDDATGAVEVLGPMAYGEPARYRRHALELMYCASRLHSVHGRLADALRTYKEFAREAIYRTMRERALVPRSRFLERRQMVEEGDAAMYKLPLRYRRAYRFIMDRLGDSQLSIKQVAAHIDVTERALQMAFRKHLGLTPAELIRHQRMQGVRNDLCADGGADGVLKTAARWGMANRSTLAHGYRQVFHESPTATLRGNTTPTSNV